MNVISIPDLNARQFAFVKEYMEGATPHQAALKAGYAEGTARVAGTQLLEHPNIAHAIAFEVRRRFVTGAPTALRVLEWLMEHSPSHKVRLDAAKTILDRAGHVPPAPPKEDPNTLEKPLNELSLEELRAKVDQYEKELTGRARDVTPDPGERH
jgi:phage terminase small subunit